MNIFAGNFTLKQSLSEIPDIDFDVLKLGNKTYFIMGADETLESSDAVIKFLEEVFGELENHDISIESEDNLEILSEEYEPEGVYECVTFEGKDLSFDNLIERFADSSDVICVREVESSNKFGNKKVRVDFWY